MRNTLISVAFAAFVASSGAALAAAGDDPVDIVRAIVGLDSRGDWAPVFAVAPTGAMKHFFTPEFNDVWARAMTHNKEFPVLDGDPLTGAQGEGGTKIISARRDGDAVKATLAPRSGQASHPHSVIFAMRRVDGHWRIDDITYADGRSLRAYLASVK